MVTYNRKELTTNAINYLSARTRTPYRLFVVDNASTDGTDKVLEDFKQQGKIFLYVRFNQNVGIHMAHNLGLALVSTPLAVCTDNDIYVPSLEPDWLSSLAKLMLDHPEYAAIACQPHAWLGDNYPKPDPSGVIEKNHVGAHMRMMRTNAIRQVGGWEYQFNANRDHEEWCIGKKLLDAGYKVGYASDIFVYHDWGNDNNWGYKDIEPHTHGHRIPGTEIYPTPEMMKALDPNIDPITWKRKDVYGI